MFWTGADRVPPLGFDHQLHVKFFSLQASTDGKLERRLPTSSTCGLVLMLPRGITEPDDMEHMMVQSIRCSAGFGVV